MKKSLSFNLDDLRVKSFDTLPELSDLEVRMAVGARAASSCEDNTCYSLCETATSAVCVEPSGAE